MTDSRGLAPKGYHVLSDEEWTKLTDFLGGEEKAGSKMKSKTGWKEDGNGSNESGFSGLPGGVRDYSGSFLSIGGGGGGAVNASNITITSTSGTILPVELISFTAKSVIEDGKNMVVLNWTTLSETNNDYYTIERSSDGMHFEELSRVQGAGTTTDISTYYAADENPFMGVSYYRLKQTDFDGRTERFDMVPVEISSDLSGVSVYPNPAKEELTISFRSNEIREDYSVMVYSAVGQVIHQQAIVASKGSNAVKLNTSVLPSGMYFLTIGAGGDYQKLKFTIR